MTYTKEQRQEIYQQALDLWGYEKQSDKAIEEMAELIEALGWFEIQSDLYGSERVIDEIADATIMLEQIIYGIKSKPRDHSLFPPNPRMARIYCAQAIHAIIKYRCKRISADDFEETIIKACDSVYRLHGMISKIKVEERIRFKPERLQRRIQEERDKQCQPSSTSEYPLPTY